MWVSLTTLKQSEVIISFSTLPGPTEGSWFTSPTKIRRVPTFTAFKRDCISWISTMDISSIMMISASRGFSSFRSNRILEVSPSPGTPFNSRRRCMVFASYPVASVIRLAARPVGAARRISISSSSKYRIIVLMVVVFPVPGPPVIIRRPLFTASATAWA